MPDENKPKDKAASKPKDKAKEEPKKPLIQIRKKKPEKVIYRGRQRFVGSIPEDKKPSK